MKRSSVLLALLFLLPAVAATGIAVVGGVFGGAKHATARFHDVDEAIAAGYSLRLPDLTGATCIEQPGQGGMASIW